MTIDQTIIFSDYRTTYMTMPKPALKPLRDFDLLYVLPEYDVAGMSRPALNNAYWNPSDLEDEKNIFGLPATVPLYEPAAVLMVEGTPQWELLFERFSKKCPLTWSTSEKKRHLLGYLRNGVAFTDHTDPTSWKQIITCGNVVYPLGITMKRGSVIWHKIRTLKVGTMVQMRNQLAKYPYLETWATISNRGMNEQGRSWFPHCGDTRYNSVPNLLFCKTDTNWIAGYRVRKLLRTEEIPALYFP